ncbi:MAG TPA: hypothetical protein VFH78_03035 [Candidatus Thermoplasmatota archaeon]|nr:hypothetical protein [Candidatus Thermoplasmatota archaeon]
MRLRVLLAPLLLASVAGCLAASPPSVLLDNDPFTLGLNETYSRRIHLGQNAHHAVTYEVVASAGVLRVCFVPDAWYADPTGRWDEEIFLDIRGCGRATPQAPVRVSTEVAPGATQHVLHAHCEADAPCAGAASLRHRTTSAGAGAWALLPFVLLGILALRLLADQWDRARIRDFVRARGGVVERIEWKPLGRGWLGERGERIYRVAFVDARGARREGTFKTSLFSGVWTDAL